jgi:hypothetical protein
MSADAKLSVAMITAANLRSICPQLAWLRIGSLLCSRSQFRCAYGAEPIYKPLCFLWEPHPPPPELLIIFNLLSRRDYSSQDRAKPRVCRSLSWRHRCLPCLVGGSEQSSCAPVDREQRRTKTPPVYMRSQYMRSLTHVPSSSGACFGRRRPATVMCSTRMKLRLLGPVIVHSKILCSSS